MSTTLDVEPIIEFKLLLPSTQRVEPWSRRGGDRREGCKSCYLLKSIIMSSRCHKCLLTSADPALVQDLGWPQSKVTPDLLTPARETQPQVSSKVGSVNIEKTSIMSNSIHGCNTLLWLKFKYAHIIYVVHPTMLDSSITNFLIKVQA